MTQELIDELKVQANHHFQRADILMKAATILEGDGVAIPEVDDQEIHPALRETNAPIWETQPVPEETLKGKTGNPRGSTKRDKVVEFLTRNGPTCLADMAKAVGSTNKQVSVMLAQNKNLFGKDDQRRWFVKSAGSRPSASRGRPKKGTAPGVDIRQVREDAQRMALNPLGANHA